MPRATPRQRSWRAAAAAGSLLLLAALPAFATAAAAAAGAKDCEARGFTGAQACSDCESMAEYIKDDELVADCKSCCTKDDRDDAKFTAVTLEVCPYRLNGLPHIQDFIAKHAAEWPQVKVTRRVGSYPKLLCRNARSGAKKSIRIDSWRVATIKEFLRERLEAA